jgi:hypothetical protein
MNIKFPKEEDVLSLSLYLYEPGFVCGVHDGDENAYMISVGEPHKKKECMRSRCTEDSNVKMDVK